MIALFLVFYSMHHSIRYGFLAALVFLIIFSIRRLSFVDRELAAQVLAFASRAPRGILAFADG